MTDEHLTTAKLEGIQGSPVTLDDFAAMCESLRISLNHIARCIGVDSVTYEVRDLRAGSAEISVAPISNGVPAASLSDLTRTFHSTVHALENRLPLDERIDYAAIRVLENLAKPVRKRGATLRIGGVTVTQEYVSYVATMLKPIATCAGSVSGLLEGVSVHGGTKFTLYPPIKSEHVECSFAPSDLPKVLHALGQKVTVHGMLRYANRKAFPVSAEVDRFEVDPPDELLPTLLDTRHEIAGGRSSVDVVREIRDGWK